MKAKILLVDDRTENLYSLEAILTPLGQELVFARSGEAAVKAAARSEFAVILLDVVMPGMDGFETARQLRRLGNAPVILLTAAGPDPDLAFRGYAAGAADYVTKPFDPWVLRAKVTVYVELYLKSAALAGLGALLPAAESAAAALAVMPDALAAGTLTPDALADALAPLNSALAALRAGLGEAGTPDLH